MPKPPSIPAPGTGAVVVYPSPAGRVADALAGVPETDLVKFTLDGREVCGRKGETVMDVCNREGVYVPHYCWHPALSIAGNCRLCLVEIEKTPKPNIACQTHIGPGMVVKTNSPQAKSSQEFMMEFLLVNHPLDCPICDRGGECQLQRYSVEYGLGHTRMQDKKRKFIKPQADPLIDIERNRCIMCTRCVRFTDEVGGEHVMGVFDRGDGNYIGTFGQGPVSNVFSGNIIDLCPVGCLTSRPFRFKARVWELSQTMTTCDGCSSGCKTTAWMRNGKLYRTTPPSRKRHDHFTVNEDTEEFICNQGRFGGDYALHETRNDQCETRRAGRLAPTPFPDALASAARDLKDVIAAHGPASVGVLLSAKSTLEEGFLAQALARDVIKTPHIDWRASYAKRPVADAVSAALRAADGDLEHDPEVVVVLGGGRLVWSSPVVAMRLQELGRRLGTKLILLGHFHDSYLSAHAHETFHVQPGRTARAASLLADAVAAPVTGSPAAVDLAAMCNVEVAVIDRLVADLRGAQRGLVVHNLDDMHGLYAPADVPAALSLRRALTQGAWGYLPVARDRNAVGLATLGVEPGENGLAAGEMLAAIEAKQLKALVVIGADALAPLGDAAKVAATLARLDALVVIDPFKSEYSKNASTLLASASYLENEGTYADIEGNLARLKAAQSAIGDCKPVAAILTSLGRAMGAAEFGAATLEDLWTKVRKRLAPNSGVTLAGLELEGGSNAAEFVRFTIDWAGARTRSTRDNPGNYRKDGLHLRGNATTATAPAAAEVAGVPAGDGFVLTWGPHISGTGYHTDRASIAGILRPKPFLEIHPRDAADMGARNEQFAVLTTASGTRAKVALKIAKGPAPGTLYLSSGVYGGFDPATLGGPARVKLELLDEQAPEQHTELIAAGAKG